MTATVRISLPIKCEACGIEFETKFAARQRFCSPCGIERRAGASRATSRSKEVVKAEVIGRIAATRGKQKTTVLDNVGHPHMAWTVHFTVPFMPEVSKNRRWSNTGQGAVFLSKGVRAYHEAVVALTTVALRGVDIKQNKLWIGLLVEKPNNRFDAINVVDTICDAIKVAAGLDDRWFCISKLDWVIKKIDPQIIISIGQECRDDVIACSHCGEAKLIDEFNRSVGLPLGRSRVCRDCKLEIDGAARVARARLRT